MCTLMKKCSGGGDEVVGVGGVGGCGQPGCSQAGGRAPSQSEQEVLRNTEACPLGVGRAPSSLHPPSCQGQSGARPWVLPLDCLRRSTGRERSLGKYFTHFPPGLFGCFL